MTHFYAYQCEHIIEEKYIVKSKCALGYDMQRLSNETFTRAEEATVECYQLRKMISPLDTRVSEIFCISKRQDELILLICRA